MTDYVRHSVHRITKEDCQRVLNHLVKTLITTGLESEIDFLVYGSFYDVWRDGLSDLDGIFYFKQHSPADPVLHKHILFFQSEMHRLYKEMPFLETGFLTDIFIIDFFHSSDGRFVFPLDKDWIEVFWKYTRFKFVHGSEFINSVTTVSLRNQNEMELAIGLSKLRNYLLFELPRSVETMSMAYAKEIIKFFKVLPRTTTIILDQPMLRQPDNLNSTWAHFQHIDFEPLVKLCRLTATYDDTINYLQFWHTTEGRQHFLECLRCFEKVLEALVSHSSQRSV